MAMEDLINAARKEDWKFVDEKIPEVCDRADVQERAVELLGDTNGNVRDLGASILGKAHIDSGRFSKMRAVLGKIMNGDSNPYARYRSAFALAEHGPGIYKKKVLETLREASKDKDVGEIAREYLERLK